jgi:nucleoside-diphosphate-sugar epimerase
MNKQVVLITGASGFIGTELIARLGKKRCIIGIDKTLHKNRNSSVLWYKADISDRNLLNEIFHEIKKKVTAKIDYVFHLAAYYDMVNKESRMYHETNENGTRYLLDNLLDFNVKNFVFASSTVVFKPAMGVDKLNEESDLSSFMYYGKSKIAGEKIFSEYKKKIKVTIFRLSAVYSYYCRSIPLANQIAFVWQKRFGYRILPGKGDGGISYIHIEDVLDAFEKSMLLATDIPSGSILILSEERLLLNKDLYKLICREIFGKQLNIIYLPKLLVWFYIYMINKFYSLTGRSYFFKPWMVKLADKKYQFNIDKAKRILKWHPKFRLEQHMKVMIKNLKSDTSRWFETNEIK